MHWRLMVAGWALNALAMVLAFALARRRAEHRPVAALLVVTLAADLARIPIGLWGWLPARAALPADAALSGWPRVAHHLDQVLFLTWPAGLALVSAFVFVPQLRQRAARAIVAAYAVTIGGLALTYPANRPVLGYVYAAASLVGALAVIVGAVVWGRRREHPRPEHAVTLALGMLELALFADPFAPPAPAPFERWNVAQLVYLCTWTAVCALHGGFLWGGMLRAPSQPGRFSPRPR